MLYDLTDVSHGQAYLAMHTLHGLLVHLMDAGLNCLDHSFAVDLLFGVDQVFSYKLSFLRDEENVRADELIGLEFAQHHVKDPTHVLLKLPDALHVQVRAENGAFNDLLQTRIEIEQAH